MSAWEPVVGLEMHARLSTRSKLFCGCANVFGDAPNTRTCPVCAGLPGSLPTLNAAAWESAARLALATRGTLSEFCRFDRKSYLYPDLPKGYQITQVDHPVSRGGWLEMLCGGEESVVPLQRIHLEEDSGKSLHRPAESASLVDLNRAGTPLLEVVTQPALHSAAAAAACARSLRQLLRILGIGDGDMEKGSLRCDVNVSVRRTGGAIDAERVEIKNLNSFRAIQDAVTHEVARQVQLREQGEAVQRETRLWDVDAGVSRPMRRKEDEATYGYVPETDLGVLHWDAAWLEGIRRSLPELPAERRRRLCRQFGLGPRQAAQLSDDVEVADFFEAAATVCDAPRKLANWLCNEVPAALRESGRHLGAAALTPRSLGELVTLRNDGTLSQPRAKQLLSVLVHEGGSPLAVARQRGWLEELDDAGRQAVIARVLADHPQAVRRYQSGKQGVLGFLVGQVLQSAGGRGDPEDWRRRLRDALDRR